ncbi:MAG: RimK family protein [Chitinispirillaceae bacterium]|jgi:glutathione synthase/RimK-type ligase-like ATP-grasp enzyme
MPNLIVVNNPKDWTFQIPGVDLVAARSYLTDDVYSQMRYCRVFNLCKSYRYQSIGYYVSLLASARGHTPLPNISTIQDLKSQTLVRIVDDELDELIQRSLAPIQSDTFTLSIYFGKNIAKRYDRLALHLYNLFPGPLLRAEFIRTKAIWHLDNIDPISTGEIPAEHHAFLIDVATEHFAGRRVGAPKRRAAPYDLAILWDSNEVEGPSNERAIRYFMAAGRRLGLDTEIISRDDYGRLAEFDSLFIRETTNVNHHTYRFARRAAAEGLIVVDDPESILKCSNKVYLAELLDHHNIPTPTTSLVHRDNLESAFVEIGVPCVLKQPDGAFSQGVIRTDTREQFFTEANRMLSKSDIVVVQEYVPTDFDWRVGIFDNKPLFVCKYFMVRSHWQVIKRDSVGRKKEGRFETLPVELAPRQVVHTALKAANLIGNGFYGVDIKQINGNCFVMEINDNPNVDAGIEDTVLKSALYERIMEIFLKRILTSKNGVAY